MHELAIAQSILEQVQMVATREGFERVETIHLRIGAMRAVVPECLELGFAAISQGTPLEGTRVEIEEVPIRIVCRDCGADGEPTAGLAWVCPSCGSFSVEMLTGRELVLESIDVED